MEREAEGRIDTNLLSAESKLVWRRRSRRPQLFEKSGFACFSKTSASCIQTRLNATWYETTAAMQEGTVRNPEGTGCGASGVATTKGVFNQERRYLMKAAVKRENMERDLRRAVRDKGLQYPIISLNLQLGI
ncbi:MAG: hypothetical protein LBP38_01365 [Desulfovibrio sp.]|jgi:hypothetical protein|nr:hypothetical protein [Desulfovibrio sp.]